MTELTENTVRNIVREEIAASPVIGKIQADIGGLTSDVSTLKTDVSTLKSDVGTLKSDVGTLKSDVGEIKQELRNQAVLYENMESKFDSVIEMLTDNLQVTRSVAEHERRLKALEDDNALTKSTVTLHSGQIAQLRA